MARLITRNAERVFSRFSLGGSLLAHADAFADVEKVSESSSEAAAVEGTDPTTSCSAVALLVPGYHP
jgi:hypothetical protein